MSGGLLVLCDTEEEYARHMTEFIKGHRDLPWDIRTYTEIDGLFRLAQQEKITVLVVAENAYNERIGGLNAARTVLLNESGIKKWDNIKNINKYQKAENVFREILQEYTEVAGEQLPGIIKEEHTRFIGMYSPVRRCLQTSFALTLGQMLAIKHRTLYLNFEHYAGITELLPDMQSRDLADLLYFLSADKDKFILRMCTIIQTKGAMDYIPPMKAGQNLLSVTVREWRNLLHRISEWGEYEYVILDLTESMQGLFEILRMCSRVFTLTKEDNAAKAKINHYEQVLSLYEYEDVLDKTCKYRLPLFHRLPVAAEEYTKGDLADYVKKIMEEILA